MSEDSYPESDLYEPKQYSKGDSPPVEYYTPNITEYRIARSKRSKRAHKQRLRNRHGKVVSKN